MEKGFEQNSSEGIPSSIEEAVSCVVRENREDRAIAYLRARREDVGEFCMQVFETYQKGDSTGIYLLARIIEKLL